VNRREAFNRNSPQQGGCQYDVADGTDWTGRIGTDALPGDIPDTGAKEAGGRPGSTTTRVPTFTRLYRSITSSVVSRMHPEATDVPMVHG
jgi:hypothetical protein